MKKILLRAVDRFFNLATHVKLGTYRRLGFCPFQGESYKARERRNSESFFEKYCNGRGLDIGYGGDPVVADVDGWDFFNGDAQFLHSIEDERYDYVYSSHCLEHMSNPFVALRNWWRVLKDGGYLILYVPHRDLYEKRRKLPSRWNLDHKWFFTMDEDDLPDTLSMQTIIEKSIRDYEVLYIKKCDFGHTVTDESRHSDGEYSIETVLKKNRRI